MSLFVYLNFVMIRLVNELNKKIDKDNNQPSHNQQNQRGYKFYNIPNQYTIMTANPQQAIKNLTQAVKKDDHNQVYEYSKLLLKQFPEDQEYQQCLIISSLKINVLDDLQTLFKNAPTKDSLKPLYVYYLYFVGEYDKTISYLQGLMQKDNKQEYRILLAQTYFKLGDQAASAKIMLQLIKDSGKLQKQDLEFYLINLFATTVNKTLDKNIVGKYKNISKEKYSRDVYYNYALLLVSLEDYKGALQYLAEFERTLNKGEDKNEINMSSVLKDFIVFKTSRDRTNHLNMDEEERELKVQQYEEMIDQTKELNLKNVLKNNCIFLNYENSDHILQNFHEILKAIDEGLQKKTKTTKPQEFILKLNKFTILLKKNRLSQATKLLKDLQTNYNPETFLNDNLDFIKGKYFLLKKSLKENKETTDILGFITNIAKLHKNLAFCLLADLKRQQSKEKELVGQLKEQNSHSAIIKNFIFSLLIKNPDLFEQYHEYLSELLEKTNDFKILDILLRLYENKQDLQKQQVILNKILKTNPKDFNSKVKLAEICINQANFAQAQELLRGVEQPEEINDINYLQHIEKNIHISIKKDQEVQTTIPTGKKGEEKEVAGNQPLKRRIKKKRRPRYPKSMGTPTEGFKADPERWLPKWQRKGYKKKGKKGAGKTQGLATVGKEETKNVFTTNASTSAKQVTKDTVKKRK